MAPLPSLLFSLLPINTSTRPHRSPRALSRSLALYSLLLHDSYTPGDKVQYRPTAASLKSDDPLKLTVATIFRLYLGGPDHHGATRNADIWQAPKSHPVRAHTVVYLPRKVGHTFELSPRRGVFFIDSWVLAD